jgi:argininosuccinate lyase
MTEQSQKTTVGQIDDEVLRFTAGEDVQLDRALIAADCIGSAAHASMLAAMPVSPPLFSADELTRIKKSLADILQQAAAGSFEITLADQDVHLAVERTLTEQLGDLGKRIHTGRSRNDQVAVDLRLFAKENLLALSHELTDLAHALLTLAEQHAAVPMPGRTHMQPGMPSSVGLWASSYTEALLDDHALLEPAYTLNDRSPLGAAASYGVPLPIDRALTARLLGFAAPIHNVLHANNSRGKIESIILAACSQIMLSLSRLAQDLMLYTMPEFGYFSLPAAYCTGSSIMPQKQNPDVPELIRAKASRVQADANAIFDILKAAPSGYNRDVQETKEPFMHGLATTRASVRIMAQMMAGLTVHADRLRAGFTPAVFATDRALELVAEGMPFRDAYDHVKAHLNELENMDPDAAIARKTHLGGTAGLDFAHYAAQITDIRTQAATRRAAFDAAVSALLPIDYASLSA